MACEIFSVTFVFVIVAAVGGCHCANGLLNQLFLRTYSNYNDGNFKVTQFTFINKSFPVQYRIMVYFVSLKFFLLYFVNILKRILHIFRTYLMQ